MCYQCRLKLSPFSCQKGERIETWKNKSRFPKLLQADPKGKYNLNLIWLKNSFQLYFDMLYGVNNVDLGINDILQLMELNFGEGKLVNFLYLLYI